MAETDGLEHAVKAECVSERLWKGIYFVGEDGSD